MGTPSVFAQWKLGVVRPQSGAAARRQRAPEMVANVPQCISVGNSVGSGLYAKFVPSGNLKIS